MTAPALLWPLPDAWIGWHLNRRTGEIAVKVCAYCPDRHAAEREAGRLKCRPVRSICARHTHERLAQLTGSP